MRADIKSHGTGIASTRPKKQKKKRGCKRWKKNKETALHKKRKNAGRLFLTFVGTKVLYKYCTTDARKSQEECRCIRLGGLVMGINVLTKPQDHHTAKSFPFPKKILPISDEGSRGKIRDEARLPLGGRPLQKAKGLWKSCWIVESFVEN